MENNELQILQTSTKEYFSTKELNNVINVVNKEKLFEVCNFYYSEFAVIRWTKKQWNTMIKKYVDELYNDSDRLEKIKDLDKYIRRSIKQMAHRSDLKNERKPQNNQLTNLEQNLSKLHDSYYYDWMGE